MADELSVVASFAGQVVKNNPSLVSCVEHGLDCIFSPSNNPGPTTSKTDESPPTPTTQVPPVITLKPTLPPPQAQTNPPPVIQPGASGKPTPTLEPTSDSRVFITTLGTTSFILPVSSSLSPVLPLSEIQQTNSTIPPSSLNVLQPSTTASPLASAAPEEQSTSHHGADPRIIVPVVLCVVALVVGCAIVWWRKIKKRRASSGEEMSEWAHGRSVFGDESEEHLNTVPVVSEWTPERRLAVLTRRLDSIEETVKARVRVGRDRDNLDDQTEKASGQGVGYGWGSDTRDHRLAYQEDEPQLAPLRAGDPVNKGT